MENKIGIADLVARLDYSYCRYKGDPVFVRVNGNKLNLYKPSDIGTTPLAKIDPYDKDFDVESLPLGYISHKGRVYYLSRAPRRRYVQGVNANTLVVSHVTGSYFVGQQGNTVSRETALQTEAFENMVLGKYPPLNEVFEKFRKDDDIAEEALDRNIAVTKNQLGVINVYFKNELVGWIAPNSNVVHVASNEMGWVVSMYLRELQWQVD